LPGATRLRLLPLTAQQRLLFIREACGETEALSIASKLRGDRVLDELTRTPFILAEVTKLTALGHGIPNSKFGLLALVVSTTEHSDEHDLALRADPLWNRADDYLKELAGIMTSRGDVHLHEGEARAICGRVSKVLVASDQVSASAQPASILRALCAHHLLEQCEFSAKVHETHCR
jgi:hypothetical protein